MQMRISKKRVQFPMLFDPFWVDLCAPSNLDQKPHLHQKEDHFLSTICSSSIFSCRQVPAALSAKSHFWTAAESRKWTMLNFMGRNLPPPAGRCAHDMPMNEGDPQVMVLLVQLRPNSLYGRRFASTMCYQRRSDWNYRKPPEGLWNRVFVIKCSSRMFSDLSLAFRSPINSNVFFWMPLLNHFELLIKTSFNYWNNFNNLKKVSWFWLYMIATSSYVRHITLAIVMRHRYPGLAMGYSSPNDPA